MPRGMVLETVCLLPDRGSEFHPFAWKTNFKCAVQRAGPINRSSLSRWLRSVPRAYRSYLLCLACFLASGFFQEVSGKAITDKSNGNLESIAAVVFVPPHPSLSVWSDYNRRTSRRRSCSPYSSEPLRSNLVINSWNDDAAKPSRKYSSRVFLYD